MSKEILSHAVSLFIHNSTIFSRIWPNQLTVNGSKFCGKLLLNALHLSEKIAFEGGALVLVV